MHFSLQAHCQKDEKISFSGSIFATARLGFHFLFIFHSFSVSILRKNENKMKWKMNEKWMKNGPKMPTVNDPNSLLGTFSGLEVTATQVCSDCSDSFYLRTEGICKIIVASSQNLIQCTCVCRLFHISATPGLTTPQYKNYTYTRT